MGGEGVGKIKLWIFVGGWGNVFACFVCLFV